MATLTDSELAELAGTDSSVRQKNWLRRQGIGFVERVDGRPTTTWEAVNHALIHERGGHEPNWEAVS